MRRMHCSITLVVVLIGVATVRLAFAQQMQRPAMPRAFEPRPTQFIPKADAAPAPLWPGETTEETADRMRVEAALARKVDVKFDKTPLSEVAAWVHKQSGVEVEVDGEALKASGIPLNTPITLSLHQISLRAALRRALRQVHLVYRIQHGKLLFTDVSKAGEVVVSAMHPVRDLVEYIDPLGRRVHDSDTLVELITTQCAPTTWDTVGGSGSLKEHDGVLIASNHYEVQPNIAALIHILRVARERQAAGDFKPIFVKDDPSTDEIMAALEKKVTIDARKASLAKLAEIVAIETGVNVMIDELALADAGIDASKVEFDRTVKDVPVRAALAELLGSIELTYVIQDELLLTTTLGCFANQVTCIYPVDDLYQLSIDDGMRSFSESIVGLVTSTVQPGGWQFSNGGISQITLAEPWNLLVVQQTREGHREIASLLAKLREQRAKPGEAAKLGDEIETRVYKIAKPETERPPGPAGGDEKAEAKPDAKTESKLSAKDVAEAIRELVEPKVWTEPGAYLRAVDDRIVVRHRRSVQARVRLVLRAIQEAEKIDASYPAGQILPNWMIGDADVKPPAAAKPNLKTADKQQPVKELSAEERIEQALATRVDVDFNKASLADVAAWMRKQHSIEVSIDRKSMTDAGIDPDELAFTLSLKQISLRAALRHLFRSEGLVAEPDEHELRITTSDRAATMLTTRIYDVGDLNHDPELMVYHVTSCCTPTTWTDVGGAGSIREFGDAIVVSQTREVHREIEKLLATLRATIKRQQAGDYTPVNLSAPDEGDARVIAALGRKVDVDVEKMSLDAFAKLVSELAGVNVIVDYKALTVAGMTDEIEFSGRAKDIPLRKFLRTTLQQNDLVYIIQDEVLLITTNYKASSILLRLIVPVGDFAPRGEHAGWSEEDFIEFFTSTFAPPTWDAVGGSGSIGYEAAWQMIFISQTPEVIEQILEFLPKWRAMRAAQDRWLAEVATPVDRVELRVYDIAEVGDGEPKSDEQVTKQLRELVEPRSWAEGNAYLRCVGDRLIVWHRPRVQEKVRLWIAEMSVAADEADVPPRKRPEAAVGGPFNVAP